MTGSGLHTIFASLSTLERAFLVAQLVKNLPATQETWVWSLGWEDPLEKEMATHSSILAWRIPWTEDSGGLSSPWVRKSRLSDETTNITATTLNIFLSSWKYYRDLHRKCSVIPLEFCCLLSSRNIHPCNIKEWNFTDFS